MKCQRLHTFLSLNRVDANNWRLAGKFDRRNNRIELIRFEIEVELLARFPFFNEQKNPASIAVTIQTRIQATRRHSRWTKHGTESAKKCCSHFIGRHNLH